MICVFGVTSDQVSMVTLPDFGPWILGSRKITLCICQGRSKGVDYIHVESLCTSIPYIPQGSVMLLLFGSSGENQVCNSVRLA